MLTGIIEEIEERGKINGEDREKFEKDFMITTTKCYYECCLQANRETKD